jgi:hypothetical protein
MTLLQAEPETESPDYQAGSLLRNFGRPISWRASWGLIGTLVLAALTFGIAPLLVWPSRLRELIAAERDRYLQLAAWMRTVSGERSQRLAHAAERIRPQPVLAVLPVMLPLLVIWQFLMMTIQHGPINRWAVNATWRFAQNIDPDSFTRQQFFVWTGGLALAYLLHWAHLLWHQARVRDAVVEFNHLAAAEGVAPVPVPIGFGLRPLWLVAGMFMLGGASALWALPMMLAGGLQRSYAKTTVPVVQGQIGLRVRQLLSRRRPAMFVPTPVSQARRCSNERCRAPVARVANFCSRCGTHVGPDVNQLA